jgi:hypothetical protein
MLKKSLPPGLCRRLREVYFKPHGRDDHQDVYGFRKDEG